MSNENPFIFDEWKRLAETDPEEFERRRRLAIDGLIAKSSDSGRPRLRCLQWRIDMERRRFKHPVMACINVYNMMWDSVYGERGLLKALNSPAEFAVPEKSADIMPFKQAIGER